ncbi:hypothetical protein ACIOWI_29770 [Streptomyces sp. NPDC087659]|uniref:hypothetical protein n=1 Tax=Streptomyces sp. NPDC087659 TaxID=3365801 RepID=UPI00380AF640
MRTSVYKKSKSVMALTSGARVNGTVNGTTVDRFQSTGPEYRTLMFVITTGVITDGSHAFTVQDSDDGTTWGSAAASDVQGTAPTVLSANDDTVFDVGYTGAKRYARLQVVTSGATTGGIFSAAAVLYGTRRDR